MTFLYIYLIGGILSVGLLAYQAAKKENGYDEQFNIIFFTFLIALIAFIGSWIFFAWGLGTIIGQKKGH